MFLLQIIGVILCICIIGLVLFLRHSDPDDDLPFRSQSTACPNCSNAVPSLPFGKHRCAECDFVYYVNKWSYAKKFNLKKGILARKFSNVSFIISVISFILIFAAKPTVGISFGFGTLDFIVYFVVFLILGIVFRNQSSKIFEGRDFYDNQLKDEA